MFECYRAGPILALNWDEFKIIDETNQELRTHRHKTGKFYVVHLFIEQDQRPFLIKMRERYILEHKFEPAFIFASKTNKKETNICAKLQSVFLAQFGDKPNEVRYNSNSMRKYWERRWKIIGREASEGLNNAHLAQTAHSQKTADEHYVGRQGSLEDRVHLLKLYKEDLNKSGNCLEEEELHDDLDAPEDEDFLSSDNDESLASQNPTRESPHESPIMRIGAFNPVRNSLVEKALTPQPLNPKTASTVSESNTRQTQAVQRDSLDMPIPGKTAREKYLKSLTSFRPVKNKPDWTENQKKLCRLFMNAQITPALGEIKAAAKECDLLLSHDEMFRVYQKIKTAINEMKKHERLRNMDTEDL